MALLKSKFSEMPKDAVLLSEREAVSYQTKILKNWKNKSDVFAFNYGAIPLSLAGALTGVYLNTYYRNKLKLHTFGRFVSVAPMVILPGLMPYFIHGEIILADLVLGKTECPICVETRASAIQALTGFVLPAVLTPLSAFSLSHSYGNFDIPYLHKEPMKVYKLYIKLTKPVVSVMLAIVLGQMLLASGVTYFESQSINTVKMKLRKLEYNLEHGIEAEYDF